jgi:hypothetical protein
MDDSFRQLHESPLNHILALNENALFIDLHSVKADFPMEERNGFLGCKDSDVKAILPDPSTLLPHSPFKTAALFECYIARLATSVYWTAWIGMLWCMIGLGDSVTAVRVSAVPYCFPVEAICDHF